MKSKKAGDWKKPTKKKTSIGHGKYSKYPTRGGGNNGSTISKKYRKKPRGQGR
jgi:hypothetical protein